MALEQGKLIHHRCGYLLRSVVFHRLWDQVVVNYRDPAQHELIVFACPKCRKPLRLWWERPADDAVGEGERPWDVRVALHE